MGGTGAVADTGVIGTEAPALGALADTGVSGMTRPPEYGTKLWGAGASRVGCSWSLTISVGEIVGTSVGSASDGTSEVQERPSVSQSDPAEEVGGGVRTVRRRLDLERRSIVPALRRVRLRPACGLARRPSCDGARRPASDLARLLSGRIGTRGPTEEPAAWSCMKSSNAILPSFCQSILGSLQSCRSALTNNSAERPACSGEVRARALSSQSLIIMCFVCFLKLSALPAPGLRAASCSFLREERICASPAARFTPKAARKLKSAMAGREAPSGRELFRTLFTPKQEPKTEESVLGWSCLDNLT